MVRLMHAGTPQEPGTVLATRLRTGVPGGTPFALKKWLQFGYNRFSSLSVIFRKLLIYNNLARMDSNNGKVIQSHLAHDGCAIVATFSGFRAASLPVCPTGS
jgi:hypothetical protein